MAILIFFPTVKLYGSFYLLPDFFHWLQPPHLFESPPSQQSASYTILKTFLSSPQSKNTSFKKIICFRLYQILKDGLSKIESHRESLQSDPKSVSHSVVTKSLHSLDALISIIQGTHRNVKCSSRFVHRISF